MYYAITMPKNHIAIIVPSLVNQMLRGGIRLPPPLPLLYAGIVARPTAGHFFCGACSTGTLCSTVCVSLPYETNTSSKISSAYSGT